VSLRLSPTNWVTRAALRTAAVAAALRPAPLEFDHVLQPGLNGGWVMVCSCGEPINSAEDAANHHRAVVVAALREPTGWRGVLYRVRKTTKP
jgi:hypothetical protein